MRKKIGVIVLGLSVFFCANLTQAAEIIQDTVTVVKARVISVQNKEAVVLPGLDTLSHEQTITAEILKGDMRGTIVTFDNDYVQLKKGDLFYLSHVVSGHDGFESFSVDDPYRFPILAFFAVLFAVLVFVIGGKPGVKGLATLLGSFVLILYVLIPGILAGYSPMLVTIAVSALIIGVGSYVTHGFNKTTTSAVVGMIITVIITGILAYIAVKVGNFSGYDSEEAVYLNVNLQGRIDMIGLLMGGIMIGLLGVLYDTAISQAISVEELHRIAPHASRTHVFKRAMRIGREHIGALVNTLAIAYAGAALPLILLFYVSPLGASVAVNREIFSVEILRILIGSIGLILAVPITTALALVILVKKTITTEREPSQEEITKLESYTHHH